MSSSKEFRPIILRKAVLLTLLIITIVLLGLVEYSCRVLPKVERKGGASRIDIDIDNVVSPREIDVRDFRYPRLAESDNVDVSIVNSLGFSSPKKLLGRHVEVDVAATPTTSEEVEAHGTSAPAPGLWLQTISISADKIEAPVTSAPPPALFLQTTSRLLDEFETPTPSAPAPDVWLQPTPIAPAPEVLLQSATTSLDEAATFSTVVPGEPAPSDWLQTQSSSLSLEIASTPAISSYLRVYPTGVSNLPTLASPPAAYLQSVTTRNGMEVTQTIRSSVILTTVSTINGKPITQTLPAFTTLITTKGTPYIATVPATATTTGQSTTDRFVDNFLGEKKDTYVNGAGMYFLGAYLPVILATFFALPWTLVGETTKSLEPFYQMAKTGGAPAERSLAANFNDLLAPLWALFRRQWTVVLSTILAWLASIIVPLAPEAIFVYVGNCDGGCNGRIGVLVPAARAIEAVLAAMAVIEIGLILNLLSRNKTCVSADPRCIAGLATLFSDVDVQREFNELYNSTDLERLGKALNGHNYRLESFLASDERTVTVTIIGAIPGPDYISPIAHEKHQYATVSTMALDQQTGMRYTHKVPAIIFAIFIAALLALIVTYRYTGGDTGFEHFMGGQGLGVKFLFTSIAVIIAWFWARLFRAIALYAPYRRLLTGNATACESILISPPIHPVLGICSSVSSRHYLLALIAVVGVLSEVLCVTLSAIPFNPATLYSAYNTSTWLSVAILTLMLLALTLVCFYVEPIMPVKPDTVAGNLVYLCDGSLPEMLKDFGGRTTKARNDKISRMGLRYELVYAPSSGGNRLVVLAVGGSNGPCQYARQ